MVHYLLLENRTQIEDYMKRTLLLLIFSSILFNNNIFADGKTRGEFPIQVQLLSGNVGAGPSIGYNINDMIYVGSDSLSKEETAIRKCYWNCFI